MHFSILQHHEWQQRASKHQEFVRQWTVPFRERRRVGKSHPVHDFLFVYYRYSSAKLEDWHPGIGFRLENAAELKQFSGSAYRQDKGDVLCDPDLVRKKERDRMVWIVDLLRRTQKNRANYSCLGLHEWAMVYQAEEIRHENTTGFRLSQSEIDRVVESRPLTCSHFDAFRFFASSARPLNRLTPTLLERPVFEQPACIHANMDLYKWAFKSMPWIGSDLLRRCFELAMSARAIDMRASPYDLSEYQEYEPIKIETAAGRAEYEREQSRIANAAAPLREELIHAIEQVLSR